MSEVNEMGCAEFADAAAELALGVLTGRERAQALAHLDHCEACRENVRQLTVTGEELVGLLPAVEPPAGFETRVMERLGLGTPAPAPVQPSAPVRRCPTDPVLVGTFTALSQRYAELEAARANRCDQTTLLQ